MIQTLVPRRWPQSGHSEQTEVQGSSPTPIATCARFETNPPLCSNKHRVSGHVPARRFGERVEWETEPRFIKRFGLTARIQIRILWERFVRVATRGKKGHGARWLIVVAHKVEEGRASEEAHEPRGRGGRRGDERVGGRITSRGTADVIFILSSGRGQRGHQRTGDE